MRLLIVVGALLVTFAGYARGAPVAWLTPFAPQRLPSGELSRRWVKLAEDPLGNPIGVPVLAIRGASAGKTLCVTAALHGNEVNGVRVVQQLLTAIAPQAVRGTLIGVPVVDVVALERHQRRFIDHEDLNRLFPGDPRGNRSKRFVALLFERLLRRCDAIVDLHSASFGRINSLYVRADLKQPQLARLAASVGADIILHSPPVGPGAHTLRAEAKRRKMTALTIELGDPQVFQPKIIARGVAATLRIANQLGLIATAPPWNGPKAIICRRSFWIYTDGGGFLELQTSLGQRVARGQRIATQFDAFGRQTRSYFAPQAGVVIGQSSNPVNMSGGRIIHLGIVGQP
ncbi:MAG: succinylglutamate desuccinylase/aspartoacylase family protein [Deltaproteobacteria bacterium]|nr:succinylglutamate desuccinylase/aspartoacylase family protein [Deltaproteobacteria bacterium]